MKPDTAIVALIPRGATGEVHSTLLYFPTSVMPFVRQYVPVIARFNAVVTAQVIEHTDLGPEDDRVKVAIVEGAVLRALWATLGPFSKSEWGYTPHITAQPGFVLPPVGSIVWFDRIAIWQDKQREAWRFGTGEPTAP